MAITRTTVLQRCEVYPAGDISAENTLSAAWPTVMVVYEDHIDDVSADDLPLVATRVKHLNKFTVSADSDGVESSAGTVVSGEDALVQTICTAVWS